MSDASKNQSIAATIVGDEQSKALATLGNFGATVVTEVGNLGRYIARVVGTVPEDAVGLVIGDPLHSLRTAAAQYYDDKVREIHARRNVKHTEAVSLSVALPLLRGAYDESREGLRDVWAALIAAAMDPQRSGRVRLSFITTLKELDPLDALVFKATAMYAEPPIDVMFEHFWSSFDQSLNDIRISIRNLAEHRCIIDHTEGYGHFRVTSYGRGLLAAISD